MAGANDQWIGGFLAVDLQRAHSAGRVSKAQAQLQVLVAVKRRCMQQSFKSIWSIQFILVKQHFDWGGGYSLNITVVFFINVEIYNVVVITMAMK